MIKKSKNGKVLEISFGKGTVRVSPDQKSIKLEQCRRRKIGAPLPDDNVLVPKTPSVLMKFSSVESLDILLDKLIYIRKEMAGE